MFNNKNFIKSCVILVYSSLSSFCYSQSDQIKISSSDTIINGEIWKEDPSLSFPKIKDSINFCNNLQELWKEYLKSVNSKKGKYDFINDTNLYISVLSFDITESGTITHLTNRNYYSPLDSLCTQVFHDFLSNLRLQPATKKQKNGIKFKKMRATILFEIKQTHIGCNIQTVDPIEDIFDCP